MLSFITRCCDLWHGHKSCVCVHTDACWPAGGHCDVSERFPTIFCLNIKSWLVYVVVSYILWLAVLINSGVLCEVLHTVRVWCSEWSICYTSGLYNTNTEIEIDELLLNWTWKNWSVTDRIIGRLLIVLWQELVLASCSVYCSLLGILNVKIKTASKHQWRHTQCSCNLNNEQQLFQLVTPGKQLSSDAI